MPCGAMTPIDVPPVSGMTERPTVLAGVPHAGSSSGERRPRTLDRRNRAAPHPPGNARSRGRPLRVPGRGFRGRVVKNVGRGLDMGVWRYRAAPACPVSARCGANRFGVPGRGFRAWFKPAIGRPCRTALLINPPRCCCWPGRPGGIGEP
jgi:hypothetical protein